MLCSVENQFVLEKWSVCVSSQCPAWPILPHPSLRGRLSPVGLSHCPATLQGKETGGGSPTGDVLSWDTYLHVLAVQQPRDLEQISHKWFGPSIPCL